MESTNSEINKEKIVMNILIIEDDKLTLNSLRFSLESLGHITDLAENGEKAISLIVNGNFDLIICDIMMPGISGLSVVCFFGCTERSGIKCI